MYVLKIFNCYPSKMKIILATNRISKPYLYNEAQRLNLTPSLKNEEDDIITQTYCNDLKQLFKEKVKQEITTVWLYVRPNISARSLTVCDMFGVFEVLKEIIVNGETKWENVQLEVLVKVGTTPETVIKRKRLLLKDINILEDRPFDIEVDLGTRLENYDTNFDRFYEVSILFDSPNDPVCETCGRRNDLKEELLSINRKMLQEEICCDAVIVTKDRTHVKCNKVFLMAHSPVFRAMFDSRNGELQEQQTNMLEMEDISEKGVRGLLAFLYYWDQTDAEKYSVVAFELLNIGHKYDIPKLEERMAEILLKKEDQWFDAEIAVKLFAFGRDLPSSVGEDLKMKAVNVMKRKLHKLKGTSAYQELFTDHPMVAMELCELAFQS